MPEQPNHNGITNVGIVGASGYTGAELLRLIAGHSGLNLAFATGDSKRDTLVRDLYPNLSIECRTQEFVGYSKDLLSDVDLVFVALPHGISMGIMSELVASVDHVIDLGSDFRLSDPDLYPKWYGREHTAPELLEDFKYGLPELFRSELVGAKHIATTGCNAAASILAITPFLLEGVIDHSSILADIKTGLSGAGRGPKDNTTFCAVSENVEAYGLLTHRHTPEIEQALKQKTGLEARVLFTPHLVPMSRGILATCYGKLIKDISSADAKGILRDYYSDEPFAFVTEGSPSTKATRGSNAFHLTAEVDERTGQLISIASLDNLMKGASGMAIQCCNIALGLPEATGLTSIGVSP